MWQGGLFWEMDGAFRCVDGAECWMQIPQFSLRHFITAALWEGVDQSNDHIQRVYEE